MTEWQTKTVGELADTQLGKMLNKGKQSGKFAKPYLRTDNVHWGRFDLSEIKEMDIFPEEEEKYLATKGDLLMCEGGASGRTAIWNEEYNISFQNAVHRIRPKDYGEIAPKYLLYYFEWFIKNGFASDLIKGVTISHLSQSGLRSIQVTYPPIEEQHKIVEMLEDHLSRLDAAFADVKQAKLKAFQFRRSLLQAAFNGYLSDELFTIGSEIPPSWRKISLGNVLEPRKQKDIPSSYPNLPYIGMEHVARDVGLIHSFGSSANYRSAAPRVYEGDVLYGRLRPYLNKVAISPCEAFASGEFIVLSPNEKISGKFLQLRLLSQDFVEFAGTLDTGDRPRVSWEQISRFELALPPIDEQKKMMSSLEDHLSRLDASVSLADAMEKQSNGLRRSLLQAAFTGQLTNEVVSV
jgi:type I restriction enzyme S subunit